MSRLRRSMAVMGAGVLSLGLNIAPASAELVDQGRYHNEDSAVLEDFCGEPGLTVRFDYVGDGIYAATRNGPAGLVHYTNTEHATVRLTNQANGKSLHSATDTVARDLSVTDNGDGTITVVFLQSGGERWYGSGAKFLFTNPGQSRFEVVIPDGGTPGDPSDDGDPISFTRIFGSTGRTDPIGCPQFVSNLT